MGLPYLMVRVRERLCALPLEAGMEMMRPPVLHAAEGEVPGLLGMTVVRGELTAVLDLGVLLGFGAVAGGRMVTLPVGGRCVGLVVDEVLGVREVEPGSLEAIALPGGTEQRMGRFDEEFARVVEAGGLVPEAVWAEVQT